MSFTSSSFATAAYALRSPADKLDVIYLESKPQINRIAGHRQLIWVVILVVITLAGVGYGAWLYKKA